jgi:hypothetical protein
MAAPDCETPSPRMSFADGEENEHMESAWMAAVEVRGLKVMGVRVIGVTHGK